MIYPTMKSPRRPQSLATLLLAVVIFSGAAAGAADAKSPEPIPGTTEYRDVRYLPAWRYSTDTAPPEVQDTEGAALPQRDAQQVMDIVVPDDDQAQHPVLFVVHGGGWSAGTKDEKIYRQIMAYFVERGYVVVGYNYILRQRGMFPQVFWDYHEAARFLRRNAGKYKVDPTKFGAIGLSSGGWLITSAGHGSGDLFLLNHQHSKHIGELWERGWALGGRNHEDTFLRPMIDPAPAEGYGKFQALSYDFSFRDQYGSGNSPATNQWAGEGYTARADAQAALDSGRFDHSWTTLTHPSYKGRKVHVPPLFESIQKDGSDRALARSLDGESQVAAIERIYQFFQDTLVDHPRTPVPEITPGWRFFDEQVEVSFVMPMDGSTIHYQVLPLEKVKGKRWNQVHADPEAGAWKSWAVYDGPIKLAGDSLVRAVATSEGRRGSTVAEAHFFAGVSVPRITAPDADALPQGKTGELYSVQFQSDAGDKARWFLAGDLVPYSNRKAADFTYPNNMVFDTRTGQWRGTPTRPGRYWVQVWVNDKPGAPARHRDYTWTVTGDDLSTEPEALAELTDPHIELLFLKPERFNPANPIGQLLNERGVRAVIEDQDDGVLILTHERDKAEARKAIEAYLEEIKFKGEFQWQD